jgi:hypothetical protein
LENDGPGPNRTPVDSDEDIPAYLLKIADRSYEINKLLNLLAIYPKISDHH